MERSAVSARRRGGAGPLGAIVALVLALALVGAVIPGGILAGVTGGCIVTGATEAGASVDLTSTDVWHVRSTDRISISGAAPALQTEASVGARALGFTVPIGSGTSGGSTTAQSDVFDVSTLALLGRVFVLQGTSVGPGGGCSGQVEIVIDDVNPLLTGLGIGSLVAALVGVLAIAWAARSPTSLRGIGGMVGLALLGGSSSILLQQTSTPGEITNVAPSSWVASVAGPTQVSFDPVVLAQIGGLALLITLLMPFPSDLFNSTLQANLQRIRAGVRRLPIVGRLVASPGSSDAATRRLDLARHRLAIAGFVLLSAALYGLLDPGFGPDPASLLTFVGILVSLLAVTWVASLPRRRIQRTQTGEAGRLRAVPGTIAIAAACVAISRLAAFEPGYLYGLVLGFTFVRELDRDGEGRAVAAGAWWMLGLALVSWLALGAVRTPGIEPTMPAVLAQSVFGAFVVAGIEGIVFGLVPLRFLDGAPLYRWRRVRWAVLYAAGVFAFLWIILNPANGFLSDPNQTPLATAVALFVGFGLVSVLFWGYFRVRPERSATAG